MEHHPKTIGKLPEIRNEEIRNEQITNEQITNEQITNECWVTEAYLGANFGFLRATLNIPLCWCCLDWGCLSGEWSCFFSPKWGPKGLCTPNLALLSPPAPYYTFLHLFVPFPWFKYYFLEYYPLFSLLSLYSLYSLDFLILTGLGVHNPWGYPDGLSPTYDFLPSRDVILSGKNARRTGPADAGPVRRAQYSVLLKDDETFVGSFLKGKRPMEEQTTGMSILAAIIPYLLFLHSGV